MKCMNCGREKDKDDLHKVKVTILNKIKELFVCDVCGMMISATSLNRKDSEILNTDGTKWS